MTAQALSAVIITKNEAGRIGTCLRSLAFCDEILVVDSGSEDDTRALCEAAGARVLEQPWLGYGPQKQFAVEQATHDWVLCLDADERVSDELRDSILHTLTAPGLFAYRMPRCNRFLGRWLRHGEGYPDLSLRLFHRGHARWSNDPIHEKVIADGEVGRLRGDLLHESQESLQQYLDKQNRYTSLQAEALAQRLTRPPRGKMLVSPVVRFLKFYFLRAGFLDGIPGLVHIAIGCMNSFMKYAKAVELLQSRISPR